ncbi:glutathione S-transferase N-terminal domain-containing protein [Bradyrhizobium sp. OAE829]|uniref:glutathione S-transferase family protein n=1 Tax=Bradyrhizobium sp. OAE829 TaxID=2663807 RepID=UPI001789D824
MLRLYFWPTPNGYKISILLEELGLPYAVEPVHIGKGQQFAPEFLQVSPNNKIPALIDPTGPNGKPYKLFESAAIMLYLAEKAGYRFLPQDMAARFDVVQWLMFQAASMAPMLGQAHHFRKYSPDKIPYAIDRYTSEAARLYRVMETRLSDHAYLAGEYSIADMAAYPWLRAHSWQGQKLEDYPAIQRWYNAVRERPAVQRGLAVLDERLQKNKNPPMGKAWDNLFGSNQFSAAPSHRDSDAAKPTES